ncbi:hypothetical protein NP493_694g01014 [Ridgeia piscesae]|uniref:Uncharacterized protein n=1 Tax=Ridgeia piscesae TaxID=27915 RepID=A0AAD9KRF9_RIDPI|nr:hypothetical protein NP493_694g01014 [Ridgeia piscesae]
MHSYRQQQDGPTSRQSRRGVGSFRKRVVVVSAKRVDGMGRPERSVVSNWRGRQHRGSVRRRREGGIRRRGGTTTTTTVVHSGFLSTQLLGHPLLFRQTDAGRHESGRSIRRQLVFGRSVMSLPWHDRNPQNCMLCRPLHLRISFNLAGELLLRCRRHGIGAERPCIADRWIDGRLRIERV